MSIRGVLVRPAIAIGVASVLAAAMVAASAETTAVVQGGHRQPTATTLPLEVVRQRPAPVTTSTSAVAEIPDRPEPTPAAATTAPTTPATTAPEALLIAGTLPEEPPVVFDRLVLVGDSLAAEADPVIRYATPGKEFVAKFFGGTAPCDWLDDDLEATPTSVVVITFTGNSLTPCMTNGSGAQLTDEPLIAKYRADVGVLIDRATAAGAWVVLVGQPGIAPSASTSRSRASTSPTRTTQPRGHTSPASTPGASWRPPTGCTQIDCRASISTPTARPTERPWCAVTACTSAPSRTPTRARCGSAAQRGSGSPSRRQPPTPPATTDPSLLSAAPCSPSAGRGRPRRRPPSNRSRPRSTARPSPAARFASSTWCR